jgi:hypothetical protein
LFFEHASISFGRETHYFEASRVRPDDFESLETYAACGAKDAKTAFQTATYVVEEQLMA